MIEDLFSHKIHSSGEEWSEKLIELAFIFARHDGLEYNRDEIKNDLNRISPRSSLVARDRSKFRDEYSAYPAYFGLYRMEQRAGRWHMYMSETAKKFLIREEPDIASFLRLQMTLFQYPNGMGAAYNRNGGIRLQANTKDRTLEFIRNGVHLSPLRLIVSSLFADTEIRQVPITDAVITVREIFALANDSSVNNSALPNFENLVEKLMQVRNGLILPPQRFENRFHLLSHLDLFEISSQGIQIKECANSIEQENLFRKLSAIHSIDFQFTGFDNATNGNELEQNIFDGDWGRYFDALATLPNNLISAISEDVVTVIPSPQPEEIITISPPQPETYSLRHRSENMDSRPAYPSSGRVLADPEVTRIKRQRRNLEHKILVEKIDTVLRSIGAVPMENEHIDLYADIPADGAFIFEVKSGGENLLEQVRKGLSQLYEYRFRYKNLLNPDLHLCMVLPSEPMEIPWIIEYLCNDRKICLCWFEENNALAFPEYCATEMSVLQSV